MARNYPNLRSRALKFLADKLAELGPEAHPVDAYLSAAMRVFNANNPELAAFAKNFAQTLRKTLSLQNYGMLVDQQVNAPSQQAKYDSSFAGRICSYMEAKGYKLFKNPGELNIVYVEGCDADGTPNADKPNEFNDRRLVIRFNGDVPKIIGNWEATTEPGFYYTDNPMNIAGAARIKFGQYLNAWQVGTHGNSAPHEALIQVAPVTVFRDYNRDMARTGDKEDTGNFGINQHAGYDYPYGNINKASAGCLVGRTWDGHEEFMAIVKADPRYKRDPRGFAFSSTIIAGDDLAKKS